MSAMQIEVRKQIRDTNTPGLGVVDQQVEWSLLSVGLEIDGEKWLAEGADAVLIGGKWFGKVEQKEQERLQHIWDTNKSRE